MRETRKLKIIRNKDGHGTMGYKIALPSKWISEMDLDNKEYAILEFNGKDILIKNEEENKMKVLKENLGFYEFESYVRKFEEEILNTEGVVNLVSSDVDEEIAYTDGIFRREYWGKGKRNGTKIKKDLLYSRTPDDIFTIYTYQD